MTSSKSNVRIQAILKEIKFREEGRMIFNHFSEESWEGYDKHKEFFGAGSDFKFRLFLAGNRTGKTFAGLFELTCHLIGEYPEWWTGKRFTTGCDWWVLSPTLQSSIEIIQDQLLGEVDNRGTGWIPRENLDFESMRECRKKGTSVGAMRVKSKDGTWSTVTFISAEQGRAALQGTARSVYVDEEVSMPVWSELITLTMTGSNVVISTFTPLSGLTDVVRSFLNEDDIETEGQVGNSKYVVRCTWWDVPHLPQDAIDALLEATPPYLREARSKGIPQLGSGAIFPVAEDSIKCEPFPIPAHWPKGGGFDVGRNTAATYITHDRESDTYYLYSEYFSDSELPSTHAASMQARGKWMKYAIDPAARGRSATDGKNLHQMYDDLGLNLVFADKSVESGLYEMLELFTQGRLKIFSTCTKLINEIRMYRRDEKGKIVKQDDHLIDSARYAIFTRDQILQTEAEAKARSTPTEITDHIFTPNTSTSWMN